MAKEQVPRRIQNIHGVDYVYEDFALWDKTKKNAAHTRRYIGKMVDTVFVPNKRYLLECELGAAKGKKPGPVPATLSTREFCGASYLFDQIGEKLGITADLQVCFPEIWKRLLSIAYYLILEDKNPLSRFPHWAKSHRHSSGEIISSQRSSDLFGATTEDAKRKFFLLQARRLEKNILPMAPLLYRPIPNLSNKYAIEGTKIMNRSRRSILPFCLANRHDCPSTIERLQGTSTMSRPSINLFIIFHFLKSTK